MLETAPPAGMTKPAIALRNCGGSGNQTAPRVFTYSEYSDELAAMKRRFL